MKKENSRYSRTILYEKLLEDIESEEYKERMKKEKKFKSRLFKIRVSFIALIVISALTYLYDTYLYNREAEKLEKLKEQARVGNVAEIKPKIEKKPVAEDIKVEEKPEEKPEEPPYQSPIDFEYWWSINPDVIGYVHVPNTNIDYPILYDEKDNERYLHESIDGKTTVHGSIYLDNLAKKDFTSKNNLIYGHNMRDGSMFKDVVKYKDFEYLKKHKTVYIYTPEREIKLKAIAAFYGNPDGSSRQTIFVDDEEFSDFVKGRLAHASNVLKLPSNDVDKVTQLFCLVTCSYEFNNARTFLYCINESDYEKKTEDKEKVGDKEKQEEQEKKAENETKKPPVENTVN